MTEVITLPASSTGREVADGPGVYVFLDEIDQMLYVGATKSLRARLRGHHSKYWWEDVRSVEFYPQETWEIALYVERSLIQRTNPPFNRQSTDPRKRLNNLIFGWVFRDNEGLSA
jgi:excinuclease UvrABC nuclease subunit